MAEKINLDKFKQNYSYVLLGITVLWALICVALTYLAAVHKLTIEIIAVSGSTTFLGVLLKMLGDNHQYWFRKKMTEKKNEG